MRKALAGIALASGILVAAPVAGATAAPAPHAQNGVHIVAETDNDLQTDGAKATDGVKDAADDAEDKVERNDAGKWGLAGLAGLLGLGGLLMGGRKVVEQRTARRDVGTPTSGATRDERL